jgi:hypothetical protein
LLNLAKITHLITRRFLCYPIFSKKGFLLKLLLVAFFFAFFFGGCLAKVFLCQRVKKNYCSFNTKLKCFCILVFSFFETCYPYFFLFWNVLSRSFHDIFCVIRTFRKKVFLLKFLLVAFFFCPFLLWLFSKSSLIPKWHQNYRGCNTKLKCFWILVFSFFGPCYTFFSVFFAPFSQKNSLDNTTCFVLSAVMQKRFFVEIAACCLFFLPFFFVVV